MLDWVRAGVPTPRLDVPILSDLLAAGVRETAAALLTGAIALWASGCAGINQGPATAAAGTPTAVSVICEAFSQGGPVDDAADAAIATIEGENPAVPTRDAIDGFTAIAEHAAGEEREDLLAVAEAMDDAAMSGEGYVGWSDAHNAFYVKYAEQCGRQLAE